jgi:hypothetical protein
MQECSNAGMQEMQPMQENRGIAVSGLDFSPCASPSRVGVTGWVIWGKIYS